jgi:putative Mg2+ transporter-C (MgtC) family protein
MTDPIDWLGRPVGWEEIVYRLVSSLAACALLGLNRRRAGHSAGLRTVMLVGLAAAVAMIQANLLLPARGKTSESFAMLDLMRLPLGILTGIGFIGAGAIVRHGTLVTGVTTAATLWFATVLGLVFGGGQIAFGWVVALVALGILAGAKIVERWLREERSGTLRLKVPPGGPSDQEIVDRLRKGGFSIEKWHVTYAREVEARSVACILTWRGLARETMPPLGWVELLKDGQLDGFSWSSTAGDL